MTLVRYLLEYTIETVCHGNRSECARRMGLEYQELKKFRKRMKEGSGSIRVTEALLEMYWRESLSIDEALKEYTDSQFGSGIEAAEDACSEIVRIMRVTRTDNAQLLQDEALLMHSASNFMANIEHVFCQGNCNRTKYLEEPCPAMRFLDYLKWLREELPEAATHNALYPVHIRSLGR